MLYTGIVPKTILEKGNLNAGLKTRLLRRASKTNWRSVEIYTASSCLKEVPSLEADLSENAKDLFYAALEVAGQLYMAMPILDGEAGRKHEERFGDREKMLKDLIGFAGFIERKGYNMKGLANQSEFQKKFQEEIMDWFNMRIPDILQETRMASMAKHQGPFEYWILRFNHSFPHEAQVNWDNLMLVYNQIKNSEDERRLKYRLTLTFINNRDLFMPKTKDFLVGAASFKQNFIRFNDWLFPQVDIDMQGPAPVRFNWYETYWILAVAESLHSNGFNKMAFLNYHRELNEIDGGSTHWIAAYSEILTEAIALMVPRNEEDAENIRETLEEIARGKWHGKFKRASRLAQYILKNERLASPDSTYNIETAITSGTRSVADYSIFLSYVLRRKYKGPDYTPPSRLFWKGKRINA